MQRTVIKKTKELRIVISYSRCPCHLAYPLKCQPIEKAIADKISERRVIVIKVAARALRRRSIARQ